MRILVIGAGHTGAQVLHQLQKNPALTVMVADPHDRPYAVEQGIIASIDYRESLTPLTLEYLLEKSKPDLVLPDSPGYQALYSEIRNLSQGA